MAARPRLAPQPLLVLLLALAALLLPATTAHAHTKLDASTPAEGTVAVDVDQLELVYSRPIELLDDTVVLLDADGNVFTDDLDVRRSDDGMLVTAALDRPLAAGQWRVVWRVLAQDSHPREGSLAFTAEATGAAPFAPAELSPIDGEESDGEQAGGAARGSVVEEPPTTSGSAAPTALAAPGLTPSAPLEIAGGVARVLFYLGLMAAAGLVLFLAGPHHGQRERTALMARVALVSAAVALVASIAEVVLHVGAVSGDGLAGTTDVSTWRSVLRTGLGTALAARTLGLTLLVVATARRFRHDHPAARDVLGLAGVVLALLSFQFVGHTASAVPPLVVRTADAAHAVAAAIWVGGLVGLALLGRRADDRAVLATTAARFSTAAIGAVTAVALAGTALAWVNLPTVAASWTTGYGRLLLAKLALVGVLAAFGAHNHFRVVPRLRGGDGTALHDLRRAVGVEVTIVVAVVVLTALLVNTSPI